MYLKTRFAEDHKKVKERCHSVHVLEPKDQN